MLDDASYYAFAPSAHSSAPPQPAARSHLQRTTVLERHAEGYFANANRTEQDELPAKETSEKDSPPQAISKRRAQSYSDFHYAVRAVSQTEGKNARSSNDGRDIRGFSDDTGIDKVYDNLEDSIFEASNAEYKSYLQCLRSTESYMARLSTDTSKSLDMLVSLANAFNNVEAQTIAFQKKCEDLLNEQSRLEDLANKVGENLRYYSFLEPITRRLNAPCAGNFVRGKEFGDMLARLDECLEYMTHHQSQKEASHYRAKYQQLLTRALTLIRMNFIGTLKDISNDVTKRIADKQINDTTVSTLLYASFRAGADESRGLAQEIRKRAVVHFTVVAGAEVEYQSLMNELYDGYSNIRGKLIIPLVKKRVSEVAMAPSSTKDLVAFARTSIGHTRSMCTDEYDLWKAWFDGDDGLYEYLESVCEPLFDYLRPRIIHENQFIKLCELCTLLQTRYFKDQDEEPEPVESNQLNFSFLIRPALEDAQTRLVFRAQAILREDIENFKPRPVDLALPLRNGTLPTKNAKANGPAMSGRKTSTSEALPKDPVIVEEGDPYDDRYGIDFQVSYQGWYPTLRRAIWLLSRIYRLLNSTVFDDLAHQIVHQTTLSLQRASADLGVQKTVLDSQLFLLKYLLILKQQIVAFDIEYVSPDVTFDFSGVTSTFYELRERGGLFDPRTLWRLVSGGAPSSLLPRVVANMLDAKAELDGRLRSAIHDLCATSAGRITAAVPVPTAPDSGKKPPNGRGIVPAIQAAATAEVPLLRQKLEMYLDDARTRETLVSAVRDQVVLNYETWHEQWSADMRRSGKAVSTKGKGKEGDVWDPSMFAEWAVGIFQAGLGYASHSVRDGAGGIQSGIGSSVGASLGNEHDDESLQSV